MDQGTTHTHKKHKQTQNKIEKAMVMPMDVMKFHHHPNIDLIRKLVVGYVEECGICV